MPPDALLDPVAEELRRSEYDIGGIVRRMLRSRLFFSLHAYRQRVKSPAEFVVCLVRAIDTPLKNGQLSLLAAALENMGQKLFGPPNVKGWDGGKAWLNTATLLARHNLACDIVGIARDHVPQPPAGTELDATKPPPPPDLPAAGPPLRADVLNAIVKNAGKSREDRLNWCLDVLLQGDVQPAARTKLLAFLKNDKDREDKRLLETVHTILLMPEYQLA
jgi:hypothetical protein